MSTVTKRKSLVATMPWSSTIRSLLSENGCLCSSERVPLEGFALRQVFHNVLVCSAY